MKFTLISALTLFSVATFSMSAKAVNSVNCNAQMIGLNEDGVSTRGLIAPTLVSYGVDNLISAKYGNDFLNLNFNPSTVNSAKGAYIIIDGRGKMMLLNVHLSMKAVNSGVVRAEMTDRVSNVKSVATFKASVGEATATLSTPEGSFHLTCSVE